MTDGKNLLPFKKLGSEIRSLREHRHETTAEVSGAVEIEETLLEKIESGKERPTEDILMLLISYFSLEEEQANELLEMAGYLRSIEELADRQNDARQQAMMVMIDPRVMYSDNVEITASRQGLVMNFSQTTGANGQSLIVSRVGMSREQAQAVMGLLHQMLYDLDNPGNPRRLSPGDGSK